MHARTHAALRANLQPGSSSGSSAEISQAFLPPAHLAMCMRRFGVQEHKSGKPLIERVSPTSKDTVILGLWGKNPKCCEHWLYSAQHLLATVVSTLLVRLLTKQPFPATTQGQKPLRPQESPVTNHLKKLKILEELGLWKHQCSASS